MTAPPQLSPQGRCLGLPTAGGGSMLRVTYPVGVVGVFLV